MNRKKKWKGILTVRISGNNPERFFNLCGFHGILIENLRRHHEDFLFSMDAVRFFEAAKLARKAGVRLIIAEKHGVAFFIKKSRAKLAFYSGLVFCAGFLYFSSLFIWDIHMEGNCKYTDSTLLSFLKEEGYVYGMKKSGIVCEDIEKAIRTRYNDITWVSAEITGTRLIIRIKENGISDLEEYENDNMKGDITAARSGTVVSIITRSGTPMIHVGDVVEEGQILISGTLEIKDEGGNLIKTESVRADGDVTARLIYHYEDQFPMEMPVRYYTGRQSVRNFFWVFGKRFFLPGGRKQYDLWDRIESYEKIHLWGNFYLPAGWGSVTVREYKEAFHGYSENEARKEAELRFLSWCENLEASGAVIEETRFESIIDGESCRTTGEVQVTESIAVPVRK